MTETFPPEVAAVRQQFEDWRAAQTQKGPLPKALWQTAAALLPPFPIALVARACRLNPSQLKQVATGQAPIGARHLKCTPLCCSASQAITPAVNQSCLKQPH